MTTYSDFKVDPDLADVVVDAATEQFGQEFRAKSRAGHEALILWLAFRADPSSLEHGLEQNGFTGLEDLVEHVDSGRFEHDLQFDPLAAVETPRTLPDASDAGGWPNGIYLIGDTPPTAFALAVEDGSGDRDLLEDALAEHGVDADLNDTQTDD